MIAHTGKGLEGNVVPFFDDDSNFGGVDGIEAANEAGVGDTTSLPEGFQNEGTVCNGHTGPSAIAPFLLV